MVMSAAVLTATGCKSEPKAASVGATEPTVAAKPSEAAKPSGDLPVVASITGLSVGTLQIKLPAGYRQAYARKSDNDQGEHVEIVKDDQSGATIAVEVEKLRSFESARKSFGGSIAEQDPGGWTVIGESSIGPFAFVQRTKLSVVCHGEPFESIEQAKQMAAACRTLTKVSDASTLPPGTAEANAKEAACKKACMADAGKSDEDTKATCDEQCFVGKFD
jgi:hypothetical protein